MTVQSNNTTATAALSDLLKSPTPVYQHLKTTTSCTFYVQFFSHFELQVIARNSDWFIMLFALVVIGHSNYFGISF